VARDFSEARFQKVYSALVTYKKIYDICSSPTLAIVPDQSATAPKSMEFAVVRVSCDSSQGTLSI
jgi:hypothetical protein